MFKILCQRAAGLASDFLSIQKGSILIYTGAFMSIGVGSAALSIDIGRMVLLTTQMQNRADAGALAGAAQLNAQDGAMIRATTVVTDSMKAFTTAIAIEGSELAVLTVTVHPAMDDAVTIDLVTPATDNSARFVIVTMARRTLSFFYAPASNILTGNGVDSFTELNAAAIAMSDPYICKAQPMMICDPFEVDNGDGTFSNPGTFFDIANIGKTIALSPPPNAGTLSPGNFGFLQLPYDGDEAVQGAQKIKEALAAEVPWGCYGVASLTTSTGGMVGPVKDGINTRFGDTANTSNPAPNVTEYPADPTWQITSLLGNGDWDWQAYWDANHPDGSGGVVPMPTVIQAGTRYQVYLFEQGVTFYVRNGGKEASVTAFNDAKGPWTEVNPADPIYGEADTIPVPANTTFAGPVSTLGQARRLLSLAVLSCGAAEVGGKSTVTSPGRYISIFLTQRVQTTAGIYGEIVRELDPNFSLEFHGNVRLVE